MRVRLDFLGCRLNFSEIEELARQLLAAGHEVIGPTETADIYILNSCTVTRTASAKSRQTIRKLRRSAPSAKIVITGCFSELNPSQASLIGADLVVSNNNKMNLVQILREVGFLEELDEHNEREDNLLTPSEGNHRTRAFLKAQDGCNNRCSYCVVPLARGPSTSIDINLLFEKVKEQHNLGYQEVVLSGVNLGSYGHDLRNRDGLSDLIKLLLKETEIPRLRLSSIEPWDIQPGFFDLFSNSRLMPHLHLPLQSGCNETMQRMSRPTNQAEFADLLLKARAKIKNVSLSTDILVGFPGETEEEFTESSAFVSEMNFSRLHVFRYSPRKDTPAAEMPNQIPGNVKKERSQYMRNLGLRSERTYNQSFLHKTLNVLVEKIELHQKQKCWSGLSQNYIRVLLKNNSDQDLTNSIRQVRIIESFDGGLYGTLV